MGHDRTAALPGGHPNYALNTRMPLCSAPADYFRKYSTVETTRTVLSIWLDSVMPGA
jgi:hypothetical protein